MAAAAAGVGQQVTEQMQTTIRDVVRSAGMWHIWTRLGVQDIKLRYRRSAIGPGWVFVNLAVLVLAIGFIYANLLGQEPRGFIPYLTVGLVMWGYLTNSIVEGGNAFVNSEGYIKQISLPIYVYVFRAFVAVALNTLIALFAFVIVAVIYRLPISAGTLFVVPGLLLVMTASLMLITIFAHLNAKYRDVAHMATVGMQVLFYVTPVIFPADLLRHRRDLMYVIELNPMYHLIEVVRRPLLTAAPAAWHNYAAVVLVVAILCAGAAAVIAVFQRRIVFAL
jgi:ABC-type polysaccharide/polyol phosphate export permease